MKKSLSWAIVGAISSSLISQVLTSALAKDEKCEAQPCTGNGVRFISGHGKMHCEGPCEPTTTSTTTASRPAIFCHWQCPKEALGVSGAGDCGEPTGIDRCEKAKLNAVKFPGVCGDTFQQCTFNEREPGALVEVNYCRCKLETSTTSR